MRFLSSLPIDRRDICVRWLGLLGVSVLLGACAQRPLAPTETARLWSGRLSLRTETPQPEAWSAGFELEGSATEGRLQVFTPIGTVLAIARWSPHEVTLLQGTRSHTFASLDELGLALARSPIPVAALFDWLDGRATPAQDWQVNLSERSNGRITARRDTVSGSTEIRVLLDLP